MKDIVNPQIWECNTQVIPKVGLSIWDFTCDSQNGNWLFFPVINVMLSVVLFPRHTVDFLLGESLVTSD